MGSVNKWIGIGNLGQDPKLAYTNSNKAVCELSIACNEVWKDKNGQKQERVEWVRVKVWNELAEHCQKYLAKGRQVYIEGKLQTRSYDKDGEKRYVTEVIADKVVFLGGGEKRDSADGSGDGERQAPPRQAGKHRDVRASDPPPAADDDIPF